MKNYTIGLLAALISVNAAGGAIVAPTLITGLDAIDPTGGRNDLNLTVTGAPTKSALTSIVGFGSIQSWTGLTATSGTAPNATGENIFTFAERPDARFSFLGESGRNAGSGTGGAAAYTSGPASPAGGESLFFGTASSNRLTIEFGTYDSGTELFAADQSVKAVGFTFSRNTAAAVATTWKVSFFDGATLLSEQTVDAGTAQTVAALFGYIAGPGENITRVQIGDLTGAAYDNKNHFVDDFGFAVVPEPSTYAALLGLLALGLVALRRRR